MQERIKAAMSLWNIKSRQQSIQFDEVVLTHITRTMPYGIVRVPKFVEIKGGTIIDPFFPLPRPVNLLNHKIAREPVTKGQYKSFLHVTGIGEYRLEELLKEGEQWRQPYPHRWSPKRDINEFWNLAQEMSWYESVDYCYFLNLAAKELRWNYTIPSRAQWMQAFVNNNAELIAPKDNFADVPEEWTSDLSGRHPGNPTEGTDPPLPRSTMCWIPMVDLARFNDRYGGVRIDIPKYSDIMVESSIIRHGSQMPNRYRAVFRPAQELIPN